MVTDVVGISQFSQHLSDAYPKAKWDSFAIVGDASKKKIKDYFEFELKRYVKKAIPSWKSLFIE